MTINDVLTNVAGAKRIAENTITRDFAVAELVKVDNVVILDKEFNVILMFNNDKLIKVLLRLIPEAVKNNSDMTNLYTNISELLSIKYGQPIKSTRQEFGPPLTIWQAQWVKNMQSIDLKMIKIVCKSYMAQNIWMILGVYK